MTRTRMPDRRVNVTERVTHRWSTGAETSVLVTYGFDERGHVRELFCADFKAGTDNFTLVTDACILVSRLMQHGYRVADLLTILAPATPSLLGTLLRAATTVESSYVENSAEARSPEGSQEAD